MRLIGRDPFPYQFDVTEDQLLAMRMFMLEQIDNLPKRVSKLLISEYAEAKRVYPPGSRRPGPWKNSWVPYVVESLNFMSPSSEVQRDIVLKGAQLGWTAAAECIVCYYMSEFPADILFMSATQSMLERWATRRLEPAIDSFGFRKKLILTLGDIDGSANVMSRRTGDKMLSKDYPGGRFDMATHNSPAGMSATDKRVLIRDEPDRARSPELTSGEGKFMEVSYARTNAWGALRKVFDISTPTTVEDSEIYRAYKDGDQRKFMVPCPHCGAFQPLEMGSDKTVHGLKPVYKAGQIVDAVYICDHCHDGIHESHKFNMINAGYWEPTTRALNRYWTSRHCPAFLSMMKSWEEICFDFEVAKAQPGGMRSFTNLIEGLPYRETGMRISKAVLLTLRGDYHWKTIPPGVLFTTVAVDVQRGSATDPNNPPRLEMEVCGHGHKYRTWSILYKRFVGPVEDAFSGAWEDFYQFIAEGGLRFPKRSGVEMAPRRIFLDSGWASHAVYRFSERIKGAYAVKGQGNDYKPDGKDKKRYAKLFKKGQGSDGTPIIIISTNDYKRIMQAALRTKPALKDPQPAGLCLFPQEYGRTDEQYADAARYFDMLNAEERLEDGSFTAGQRRNEASDCRVYNLCAADSWIYDSINALQIKYRQMNASESEIKRITRDVFLTKLERDTASE
jgi:phage terminase large subunit GpA-like protein